VGVERFLCSCSAGDEHGEETGRGCVLFRTAFTPEFSQTAPLASANPHDAALTEAVA
jgi:hypothetical protein